MSTRSVKAAAAGLATAVAQYALQPLPALAMGYQQEQGFLTLAPTWTSWWWALSAVALGAAVATVTTLTRRWTTKSHVILVTLAVATFYVANFALAIPYLTSEWWAASLASASFSGATVLAGILSAIAGWYMRKGDRQVA